MTETILSKCKYKKCKKPFEKKRPWHEFCQSQCRTLHWREEHPYIKPEELAEIKKRLGMK